MNCIVCLTDMDQIVAASGNGSKELLNRYISKELEYAIQARKQIRTEKGKRTIFRYSPGERNILRKLFVRLSVAGT